MKIIIKILIIICSLVQFSYAKVAAIVGEEVVSVYDLEKRIQLIVNSQPSPMPIDKVQEIIPLALQELTDEKSIEKEARINKIFISENEIQQLISKLSKDNKIQESKFEEVLKSKKISFETLKSRLRKELIMSKLVSEIILPKINVSEKEIYEIVHTNPHSEINLTLKKILINFIDDRDLEKKRRIVNDLRAKILDCTQVEKLKDKKFFPFSITDENVKAGELNEQIRNEILNTDVNKPTKTIKIKENLQFYVVCSKEYIGLNMAEKSAIHEMLLQNKLSVQVKLFISQLRKRNHVDIKTENLEHITFAPNALNVVE